MNNPNKTILVFGEYGILNGGENSFLAILPLIQSRGWKVVAAVPTPSAFASALDGMGVRVVNFSTKEEHAENRKSQEELRTSMASVIDSVSPTLIHCNSLSTSRLMGPVAKQIRVPAIGYLRDILKLSRKVIEDINCLDQLIAVSHATRDWHVGQGFDPAITRVIHNGVDSTKHPPDQCLQELTTELQELGIQIQDRVLLSVGQIGMRKGVATLIESFEEVTRQLANAHLLIVGSRNSQKLEAVEYERLARQASATISNPSNKVVWLGRRTDVPVLMARANLLIHAANQEPLGRVLLEASASGLPFIATDVGGTREIIGETKLRKLMLCEPKQPQQLANLAVELLTDENLYQRVRDHIHTRAINHFSLSNCANQLCDVYDQLAQVS